MRINTKETLRIYLKHIRNHSISVFVIVVSVVAASAVGVIIPIYFKRFFDQLTAGGARSAITSALIGTLIIIAILELARWLFWRVAVFFNSYFVSAVTTSLAVRCFEYLHKHSFTFFNNSFVGSLVKRVNWFTRAFESVTDKVIWNILPLITDLTVVIVVLYQRNQLLGNVLLIWLMIFLIINWLLTRYKLKYDILRNEAETKATSILADTITNNNNVKLFNGYSREVSLFKSATEKVKNLRKFTWNLEGIFDGVQGFLVFLLEIGIFYAAIRLWQQGTLTVGDFVLIQSYVIIVFEKIWNFGKVIRYLYTDLTDAEEMTTILITPHEIQDVVHAKELQVTAGKIAFADVNFNYHETRKILTHLNLVIAPKEKVALVGPSGAGKSTIIKLLLRMHDVTGGKILIDGEPVTGVTQESLWHSISMVPQDPILFHRTLMENIRYGKPDATDEEVIAAAKMAHCHEFITSFPEGYNTYVGERGVKLSGGERQRVAIARAILRSAPILVLDEATSSLDSESESLIQDALATLMRDKTVIVIAHRLSTIMKMDRIIVVDRGEVMEQGTHRELLAKSEGVYKQFWKLQAGGFMQDMPAATPEEDEHKHAPEGNGKEKVEQLAEDSVRDQESVTLTIEPQII